MANQVIYGRQPVAEAEGGRRQVHRVWRGPETNAYELERLCGSPDHQGVVAEVDPYPYGDARGILRQEEALIVALDQVQDPRNLGAVCRSAEFAGASGVIVPERRAAAGRRGARPPSPRPPARTRPAPSSISKSPTSVISPTGSPRPRPPASGSGAPAPAPREGLGASISRDRRCSSSAVRARASGRGWPPPAMA